ncbi:hypothetical protein GDO81_025690 [Engystomops pustulosus]|uniref:Uncharacterized protein n=1 Tax=Engystomops pustulosus TaxID=76066 RepID=A0AAV6YRZ9_ENGPU|nr:hypothetical protein GDO81_025690 [Engystomops pustulosus]
MHNREGKYLGLPLCIMGTYLRLCIHTYYTSIFCVTILVVFKLFLNLFLTLVNGLVATYYTQEVVTCD